MEIISELGSYWVPRGDHFKIVDQLVVAIISGVWDLIKTQTLYNHPQPEIRNRYNICG